ADARGARFFVMYGQTEATARIAVLPPEHLRARPDTVGRPIDGVRVRLEPHHEALEPAGAGELVVDGPNVMLGYAESAEDLARGDDLNGVLHTGDLATIDDEGFITIVGRRERFIKLVGRRVSLDHLEATLTASTRRPVACTGDDDGLRVVVEG